MLNHYPTPVHLEANGGFASVALQDISSPGASVQVQPMPWLCSALPKLHHSRSVTEMPRTPLHPTFHSASLTACKIISQFWSPIQGPGGSSLASSGQELAPLPDHTCCLLKSACGLPHCLMGRNGSAPKKSCSLPSRDSSACFVRSGSAHEEILQPAA